jgi:serine/threonine protein kinase
MAPRSLSTPAFPPDAFAPFHPICEIGQGAHGSVFLADGPSGRIALKVCLRPEDPRRAAEWEREKRGWSLFSRIPPHPGLVRPLGTGETPDGAAFWVAMELADPESENTAPEDYRPLTLASVAEAEVALPLRRCLEIGTRLASALEHLQRHHLLHRDIKPGNVLFVRGAPVLADAGLVVDDREAASLVGTPGYEPPEHHGTPQGDVFSLGRTLWRIGTGRAPEEAGFAPCAEADTSDPDYWRFLAIIGKATSPVPERRYRSAKAFRKELARLLLRQRTARLRRCLVPTLAALCVALLLALVWALGHRSAASTDTPPKPAPEEPDPLDALREPLRASGLDLRNIHIVTPGEVRRMFEDATAPLRELADDLRADQNETRRNGENPSAHNDSSSLESPPPPDTKP